jgi:predicted Zn finger-like uncharacterized protein
MAVYVACPSCETRLKVPDNMVGQGRMVKCPKCAKPFNLAAGADEASPKADTDDLEMVQDEPRPKSEKSARERRDDEDDEDDEDRPRPRKKRPRDDENEEEDDGRPRGRKGRSRDDEDDEYDDRSARRKSRKAPKKKSGGSLGLIIGLSVGGVVLLLVCCGVGGYFLLRGGLAGLVDNPAVTDANFQKVQTGMQLPAVEAIFGPGGACSDADAKAAILAPGPFGLDDMQTAIANDPKSFGLTAWYRWKNGPTTMLIGVDNTNQVRVAGLFTKTANNSSRSWKANVNRPGGAPGGIPPMRRGRGK